MTSPVCRARHIRTLLFVLIVLPVAAVGTGAYTSTAFASGKVLERALEASRELNYRGTFVYRRGDHMEAIRIAHRFSDGDMRERLYSLSGSPREVIRDSNNVWCYVPERNAGFKHYRQLTKTGFPRLFTRDPARIEKFYTVKDTGADRIAGYEVRRLSLTSRDEYRYGYLLWPHQQTGLLLGMDLLDEGGRSMEAYMFAALEINGTISEQELQPAAAHEDLVWVDTGGGEADQADQGTGRASSPVRWKVGAMPPGFRAIRGIRRHSPVNEGMMEHLVLSDGLAVVSVFVEPLHDASRRVSGLNRMGAVHAYGLVIEDHQITVIGEVPAVTVRMMGDSVARTTDTAAR